MRVSPFVNSPERISIEGRVTIDNSAEMRIALWRALRSKCKTVTVDLSKVDYIDSSGLATLLEATGNARRQNKRVVIQGIHGQARNFMEKTHLDQFFNFDAAEPWA